MESISHQPEGKGCGVSVVCCLDVASKLDEYVWG